MIQPAFETVHTIKAPPEKVFEAWTVPEQLERWWCMPTHRFEKLDINAVHGGTFKFQLTPQEGVELPVCFKEGTYKEVLFGEKLVCSWAIRAGDFEEADAELTVLFRKNGENTDLYLHHSGFHTEDGYNLHARNWSVVLSQLAEALSRETKTSSLKN